MVAAMRRHIRLRMSISSPVSPGSNRSVSEKPLRRRLTSIRVVPSRLTRAETPMNDTEKPAKSTTPAKTYEGFTDEERGAMKERANRNRAEGASDVLVGC